MNNDHIVEDNVAAEDDITVKQDSVTPQLLVICDYEDLIILSHLLVRMNWSP